MNLIIKPATHQNLDEVKDLLLENNLPTADIYERDIQFLTAMLFEETVAVIGVEIHNKNGLLRSLAVKEEYKNKGIGEMMIKELITHSFSNGLKELFLLTTTADRYFEKFFFTRVERNLVPPAIKASREFSRICPASAIVMKRPLA